MQDIIHTIRDKQVILDSDLAMLYGVPTKALNQAVKRNIERFPEDFMFQLNKKELTELVTNCDHLEPLKFSYSNPYAFTEQGVAMLSGVLRSKQAVEVNIKLMRSFVKMRRFLQSNAQVFERITNAELKLIEHDSKFDKVFNLIESKQITPSKGIFFEGQIFDSHKFICNLIKQAKKSIILIDTYVDESVLNLFNECLLDVVIYTKTTPKLEIALDKYNSQYKPIDIINFTKSHDRFLIIDSNLYHIGASLKDLGKKWFAFSKFEDEEFLKQIKQNLQI